MKTLLAALLVATVAIAAKAESSIETAFSPDGQSEALVLKVIHSARSSIRLSAYSFTLPSVANALVEAEHRGVDVKVVVDEKDNINSRQARAALNLLVNAGIPTRTISVYPIHHDKFIVADGASVETGSFNYSKAAATRNSENVLVIWNDEPVASSYMKHWQSRFDQGVDYKSEY